MELVVGGELFQRIARGRVSENKARQYFQQLVDGVDFCHKKGVAHRDLKPENLLVDKNGDIKITDFGFSSMKGIDVNTGLLFTQCGTPDYCAPEIIDADKAKNGYTGAKVDAWSCGIILYALLTGRLPFVEQDTDRLYDLILRCDVRYPDTISPSARDLLENLLVRDPAKRFDFTKVKRHPWFLVDYNGDDARLIKKRPFFNKNQRDLTGSSGPSSPMTTTRPDSRNGPIVANGIADHATTNGTTHATLAQSSEPPLFGSFGNPIRQTASLKPNQPEPLMDAGNPRNIHQLTSVLPPIARMQTDSHSNFRPNSPATGETHVRVPTPPSHDVFTRVQDRPATPARRHTSVTTANAFKAAVAAAQDASTNGYSTPTPSAAFQSASPMGFAPPSNDASRMSPTVFSKPMDHRMRSEDDDDSTSDQDSTEDYEEKPAPTLEMPSDPRQLLQISKDGRRQLHSMSHPRTLRQRSDLASSVVNGSLPVPANSLEQGSASLSALQRPKRVFARDPTNSGSVGDMRPLRIPRTPEIPGSPPVVYSPASQDGPSYDRFRSVSPGFNSLRGSAVPDGTLNGGHSSGLTGSQHPWQSSGAASYVTTKDEVTSSGTNQMSIQTEILLRHHWSMLCKWRGSSERANPKLSQELRHDLRLLLNEMKQINRIEDKANMFTNFLIMFEHVGLSDASASSPGFGSQNTDEEYEAGPDSKEPQSMSGDLRPNLRLAPTDISSEEEPLSWSPVVADMNGHQMSDLQRRRNLSDLLNRWIRRTDAVSQSRPDDGDGDDSNQMIDVMELQRLMREHHGGREESNLAEDLLRMMNNAEEGAPTPFDTLVNNTGQSPPASLKQMSRSNETYGQGVRYPSGGTGGNGSIGRPTPGRSISNSNSTLPPEYIPGRFNEPNSMPARGRNGNDRMNGLVSRGNGRHGSNDVGDTIGGGRHLEDMASSMGMHNVPYYTSDRRSGMANKLRGVLQTMKAKNHRLGENHAQFQSDLPADVIMQILGRLLQEMGAKVTIQKETRRKMKCELKMQGWTLYAGIEVSTVKDGMTRVSMRRSKLDRGKTDTQSFHKFFARVQSRFEAEAKGKYPSSRVETSTPSKRKREVENHSRTIDNTSFVSATS